MEIDRTRETKIEWTEGGIRLSRPIIWNGKPMWWVQVCHSLEGVDLL